MSTVKPRYSSRLHHVASYVSKSPSTSKTNSAASYEGPHGCFPCRNMRRNPCFAEIPMLRIYVQPLGVYTVRVQVEATPQHRHSRHVDLESMERLPLLPRLRRSWRSCRRTGPLKFITSPHKIIALIPPHKIIAPDNQRPQYTTTLR